MRELNQQTSHVMERVKRGEVMEVTERGELVAPLLPAQPALRGLERLVAEGRAVPPTLTGPIPMPAILGDPNVDAAAAIAEIREQERY